MEGHCSMKFQVRHHLLLLVFTVFILFTCMPFKHDNKIILGPEKHNSRRCLTEVTYRQNKKGDLLFAHLVGRLGNQLWIYSSLIGMAKKTNRIPIACVNNNISKVFANFSIPIYTFHECKKKFNFSSKNVIKIKEKRNFYYDVEMIGQLLASNSRPALISGFFQNFGYFIEYSTDIRAELLIRKRYRERAQVYLQKVFKFATTEHNSADVCGLQNKINKNCPVFVSIHVRRGDVLKIPYNIVPDSVYFQKAMDYFRNKFETKTIFVVISNDFSWSKLNIKGEDVYFTGEDGMKSREDDFAIAVACNHTIMSMGSFGWWIGFLTGGDVIYKKHWIKDIPFYHPEQHFPSYYKPLM